jgi:tetratricopeptide (TPR) repeat protein
LRDYQEALALDPALSEARAGLREVLERLPPAEAPRLAQEALRRLTSRRPETAEGPAREAVAREPENPLAHLAMARVFDRLRRHEDAAREYAVAQEWNPGWFEAQEGQRKAEAALLADQAYDQLKRLEYLNARDTCQRAIELDANNAKARAVLGNVWLELDETDAGREELDQAQRLDSREPVVYVGWGLAHLLQGQPSWYELTALLKEQKTLGERRNVHRGYARTLARRIAELRPLAEAAFRKAREQFRHALSLNRNEVLARNGLGAGYYMGGWYIDAVREFRDLLRLDKYHVTYYNLGNAYLGQRRWREAVRAYDEAIALSDTNAGAHAQRALALFALRRYDEARRAMERAKRAGLMDHEVYERIEGSDAQPLPRR